MEKIPNKIRQKIDTIAEVYNQKLGNVSATCVACKISRRTFYNYKDKYDEFADKLASTDEQNIDFAESMLLKKIREGDSSSIHFFLRTKGRNRGYIEKVEQEVKVNPFLELMQSLPND